MESETRAGQGTPMKALAFLAGCAAGFALGVAWVFVATGAIDRAMWDEWDFR